MFEGRTELLMSLNLKELVLKKNKSITCAQLLVPVRAQCLEYLKTTDRYYAELLVRGSLQSLEVLDLRTMFELPADISHEVAVAIMLLPELRTLAGDCGIIRQVVDQNPNSWAVCTADDIVDKSGKSAYSRIS